MSYITTVRNLLRKTVSGTPGSSVKTDTDANMDILDNAALLVGNNLTIPGNVGAATFTGDGSALTGIGSGTGGVINTGSTTIGADSDDNGTGEIALQTRGVTRVTVGNDGDIGIGVVPTTRDNTHLQIVDGVGFPSTQVPSTDPNTLDDYEEGTWTPVLTASTTPPDSVTYAANLQNGTYVKIGCMVFFEGIIGLSAFTLGAGAGDVVVSGLPFTTRANEGGVQRVQAVVWVNNVDLTTGTLYVTAQLYSNDTKMGLQEIKDNGATTAILIGAISNTSGIRISGSYRV